jgi:hypothetical protein
MLNTEPVVDENIKIIRAEFKPIPSKCADYREQLYSFIEPILINLAEAGMIHKKNIHCILV